MDIITLRRNKKTPIKDSYFNKFDEVKENIKFERERKTLVSRKAQLNKIIASKRNNIYINSVIEEIEKRYKINMNNFYISEELKIDICKLHQNVKNIFILLILYFYSAI